MFVGRKEELKALEEQFNCSTFELAVIYGRRRVGKTFLIQKFIEDKGKQAAYFVGIEASKELNLHYLSQSIYQLAGLSTELPAFTDFGQAFRFLFELATDERLVFVIDEFPYLAEAAQEVSSQLQHTIDAYRNQSNLMLILCGSSMSFMEEQVLSSKSPLYGRRTSQYHLKPFTYLETGSYLKGFSNEEKAILYGVSGGVAEYLSFIDCEQTVEENICQLFLSTRGRLYEEPANLMKQELREPKVYNDILNAISQGASKANQIATKAGLASNGLNHYINSLISLQIVQRQRPVGQANSRKTIYQMSDSMFRFWYRFVQPHLSLIELGLGQEVYQQVIQDQLSDFMGEVFERIAVEYLEARLKARQFNFLPESYGRWWGNNPLLKQEEEIDLVAVNKQQGLFVECKWRNSPSGPEVLADLKRKSMLFPQTDKYYWLLSKSSFNWESTDEAVSLLSLDDLYEVEF